jgi:hypothetical protein
MLEIHAGGSQVPGPGVFDHKIAVIRTELKRVIKIAILISTSCRIISIVKVKSTYKLKLLGIMVCVLTEQINY